jgi:hypothetical protein
MNIFNIACQCPLTTGRMIPLIVHQKRYRPSDINKNVDIKFSAHDTLLDQSRIRPS